MCIDYQEMKIQEQVQSLTVGSIPRSIVVVLENDLVDRCKVTSRGRWCSAAGLLVSKVWARDESYNAAMCTALGARVRQAGDDVEVTGTVMHRWHRIKQGQRLELEVIIHANHVRISQDANAGVTVTDGTRATRSHHCWPRGTPRQEFVAAPHCCVSAAT